MSKYLFTSESVTEGHPDKVCDRISDAVLDEVMAHDPNGRVACEVCCTTGMVMVMGEITTEHFIDFADIARSTLKEIGYDSPEAGFDGNTCAVMVAIDEQSPDIAMGTNDKVGGAGDQGMMFGYACKETPDLMPLPITLANKMAYLLTKCRKEGIIEDILPDGKTQVTVEYDEGGNPLRVATVVISTQHRPWVCPEDLAEPLEEHVIKPVLEEAKSYLPDLEIEGYDLRWVRSPWRRRLLRQGPHKGGPERGLYGEVHRKEHRGRRYCDAVSDSARLRNRCGGACVHQSGHR